MQRGEYERVVIDLGLCECPGTPHERDTATVKSRLTYGQRRIVTGHMDSRDGLGQAFLFLMAIEEWTLVGKDGKPLPVDIGNLDSLSSRQSQALVEALDTADDPYILGGPVLLPNPSSGPSASGSAEPSTPPPSESLSAPPS